MVLALAIWPMTNGSFTQRENKGLKNLVLKEGFLGGIIRLYEKREL